MPVCFACARRLLKNKNVAMCAACKAESMMSSNDRIDIARQRLINTQRPFKYDPWPDERSKTNWNASGSARFCGIKPLKNYRGPRDKKPSKIKSALDI